MSLQLINVIHQLGKIIHNGNKHAVTPIQIVENIVKIYMYIDENLLPLVKDIQNPQVMDFVVFIFNRTYYFQKKIHKIDASKRIKNDGMRTLLRVRSLLAATIQNNLQSAQPNEQTKLALARIIIMDDDPKETTKPQQKRDAEETNAPADTVIRRSPRNVPRVNYAGMV